MHGAGEGMSLGITRHGNTTSSSSFLLQMIQIEVNALKETQGRSESTLSSSMRIFMKGQAILQAYCANIESKGGNNEFS